MKPILYAAAGLAVLITGCSTAEPKIPQMKMAIGVPDGTVEYQPVSPRGLALRMLSKPTLFAGEDAALNFSLINNSRVQKIIPEWYAHEPDNIKLFVQPWLPGETAPAPDGWIELPVEFKKPVMHFPLTLMPGNQVIISKKLPFIRKLQVSPGMSRRYFIRAELNLKSLKLTTDTIAIQVVNQQEKERK